MSSEKSWHKSLLHQGTHILLTDGPIEFLRAVTRFANYHWYKPLMRALSPDMTTHTIEGTKITVPLHTKWAYDHFLHPQEPTLSHDFVSEIRSSDTVYYIGAYLGY